MDRRSFLKSVVPIVVLPRFDVLNDPKSLADQLYQKWWNDVLKYSNGSLLVVDKPTGETWDCLKEKPSAIRLIFHPMGNRFGVVYELFSSRGRRNTTLVAIKLDSRYTREKLMDMGQLLARRFQVRLIEIEE